MQAAVVETNTSGGAQTALQSAKRRAARVASPEPQDCV